MKSSQTDQVVEYKRKSWDLSPHFSSLVYCVAANIRPGFVTLCRPPRRTARVRLRGPRSQALPGRLLRRLATTSDEKSGLAPPPAEPDPTGKKLRVRCSGGLQAAVRAKGAGKKDFGLEAKATFAKEVSGQENTGRGRADASGCEYQERSTPRGLRLIAQGFRTLGCAG